MTQHHIQIALEANGMTWRMASIEPRLTDEGCRNAIRLMARDHVGPCLAMAEAYLRQIGVWVEQTDMADAALANEKEPK
jgi:hypothetical protein